MAELTNEQKLDLNMWQTRLRISLIIAMLWILVITPLLYVVFRIGETLYWINVGIIIALFTIGLYIRHSKRCPNCNGRIAGAARIITLPQQCNSCGVKFK